MLPANKIAHPRLALLAVALLLYAATPAADADGENWLNQLSFREVGPWRGGRVTAVAGVPGNDRLYYMGAAGGGVWRTVNAGATWENLSDGDFEVGTIGAIAVAPSDSEVLWVGTGEAPIRGVTTSHGDGVWRSMDGGMSWAHLGLENAGQIARIEVHPDDPDTAWVAVQGRIWGPSEERGVYKTTDGGATWRHVLFVDAKSGATDLVRDPTNPRRLYAALWHHGRTPWFIESGGPGGGIYRSVDGGESWQKSTDGLPEMVGKIGIGVAASEPSRLYAIVEAELGQGGLVRSDDYGVTWRRVNERRVLHTRAWYYNHLAVDPTDPDTVWVMNVPLMKSIDGGESFERVSTPHSDHHDHWINPDNPRNMISGNDGGATVTFDGGETWSTQMNQPTAQFYRVITDNQQPFRIYGGQQDNTTVGIASASEYAGIGPEDYFDVGGGESAHIAFDPDNPVLIYATTINNTLTEYDRRDHGYRSIVPYPEHVYGMDARDLKYRANWNAPVIVSPHDPGTIYYGTQLLLRSTDRGRSWSEISPDLTRNEADKQGRNGGPFTPENVGAEYYNTIFALVESPHRPGEIWVGADDGLLHVTPDGGENWENVTPRGAPEGMVNAIEISPHDPDTVYFPLARYKLDDFRPYLFVSNDRGRRWRRIDEGLPEDTFVRVVREDPARRGLLYAGTEAGLFLSRDDGGTWAPMDLNLPPVPITDLAIRQDALVVATQGRGFWVLDDLSLVRQLTSAVADKALHLFQPRDARLNRDWNSAGRFEGANPPAGLVLSYALDGEGKESPLAIEILDENGRLVRRYDSEEGDFERCRLANMDLRSPFTIDYPPASPGLHQWEWDLRRAPLKCIDNARIYAGHRGAHVLPGTYQARVSRGDESETVRFQVLEDPRRPADEAQWATWERTVQALTATFNDITSAIEGVRLARASVDALAKRADGAVTPAEARDVSQALTDWERRVTQLNFDTYEDEDSWPTLVDGQVANLLSRVSRGGAPVSAGALERQADLAAEWSALRAELEGLEERYLVPINRQARELTAPHVPRPLGE